MAPGRPQPKNKLQEWFPNTKLPVIISAPMLGVSNGTLAAQVSRAGGFGLSSIRPLASLVYHILRYHASLKLTSRDQGSSPEASTSTRAPHTSQTSRRSSRPRGTPSA